MNIYNITKRIIESSYHCLNSISASRVTNILISFGMWLMEKKYSVTVVGINEIDFFDVGFNKYFKLFLEETKSEDINLTKNDFGEFNKDEYLKNVKMYKTRTSYNPATVIFLQALQGFGKSTIAKYLSENLINCKYIEQDMFYGNSISTLGAFYHAINNSENDIIILSRCNINESQYLKYLNIASSLPTNIVFVSSDTDKFNYYMSLFGVFSRGNTMGKSIMTYSEAEKIVKDNYLKFSRHKNSLIIKTYNNNGKLQKFRRVF